MSQPTFLLKLQTSSFKLHPSPLTLPPMDIRKTVHRSWRVLHGLIMASGVIILFIFLLSFTQYPWKMYTWISRDHHVIDTSPSYIVVMGGGGIPSESGLLRTWYAAEDAHKYPLAKIIVALPDDGQLEKSHTDKMLDELTMRGVAPERLLTEKKGRNTREQAMLIKEMLGKTCREPILIVTSGPHMKRSLLTFRKLGFTDISGCIAEDESVEMDLTYDPDELGGRRNLPTPATGGNTFIRYRWWNNLQYLLWTARELSALSYYWIRGWI